METNVKDIYAAGDLVEKVNLVTGKKCLLPLAGPANREGRTAGMNMAGGDMEFKGVLGSAVVGFDGFVMAQTGLTYKQALEAGFDADYVYTEDVNRASYFPVHGHIFMMTVFEKKSGKLLGVSACGPDTVEKKVDHAAVALYAGLTVYDLEHLELCYAPPFASAKDNLNIAGFVASNMLRGSGFTVKPEWLLEQVRKNADIQIIDVRRPEEFENYRVEGAVNILCCGLQRISRRAQSQKLRIRGIQCHRRCRSIRKIKTTIKTYSHSEALPKNLQRCERRIIKM
jgi:hypothetical protein